MKGDWFNFFESKLYLTDEAFEQAKKALEEDLQVYLRYIREGDRVLEAACGPGYTAIPLSHYFKVTAFDRDERVLAAARENARKFGKDIEFIQADFFNIAKKFGKDSFDAVSSGGVLEHFPKDKIRKLLSLQLEVAPVVFASMPLFTEQQVEEHQSLGIETFHYTEEDWLGKMLRGFNVVEHRRLPERPVLGGFRELIVVVKRKR